MSHEIAIRAAVKQQFQYRRIFDIYLGSNRTSVTQQGQLLQLYNLTRGRLFAIYTTEIGAQRERSVREIMKFHRAQAKLITQAAVLAALSTGTASARRQHHAYASGSQVPIPTFTEALDPDAYYKTIAWEIDAQVSSVRQAVKVGTSPRMVLGDKGRVGSFSPWPIAAVAATWAVMAGGAAVMAYVAGKPTSRAYQNTPYRRQAIAVVDERTTKCCLQVSGQVRKIDEPFKLTGTPRYADKMENPPFHRYCRTTIALYLDEFDDGLTEKMESAAKRESDSRTDERVGTGLYPKPHPANALTRFDW